MTKGLSVYLDLVRFTAALMVFFAHLTFPAFSGGLVPYQGAWAGAGVAIFFVLSGYVIAYVATEKERTLTEFAASRLARVYSVALPAIVVTVLVDLLSLHLHWPKQAAEEIPIYQYQHFAKYFASAMLFLNQAGNLHEPTFGNGAFWSLDYEVFYYMIFAAAWFYAGARRLVLVTALMLIAGPRAILYFPMWLLGAGLYWLHSRVRISEAVGRVIFAASIVAFLMVRIFGVDQSLNAYCNAVLGGWPMAHLGNSQNFAGDFLMAGIAALNFLVAPYASLSWFKRRTIAGVVTYLASFTFALYLMHLPLRNAFRYALPYDPTSVWDIATLAISVLVSVWLLGFITEHRKKWWRMIFSTCLENIRIVFLRKWPRVYQILSGNAASAL